MVSLTKLARGIPVEVRIAPKLVIRRVKVDEVAPLGVTHCLLEVHAPQVHVPESFRDRGESLEIVVAPLKTAVRNIESAVTIDTIKTAEACLVQVNEVRSTR